MAAVYCRTEGNPLFVGEVVRLLAGEGRLADPDDTARWTSAIPDRVREAVGRRLDQLSRECNEILGGAAVIGRDFDLAVLEPVSRFSGERLRERLDEAARARLVTPEPGDGRYRFSHVLIRDALYEELGATERVRLHQRVCPVLEEIHGADLEPYVAELAHHVFAAAAPGGGVDRAAGYAFYAGDRAMKMFAYEDAVGHYRRALRVLELRNGIDESVRCEFFLALGDACSKAGDSAGAREAFLHAAEVARKRGAREQLARAALGYSGPWSELGRTSALHLDLLEEALAMIEPGDSSLRALLMSRFARELTFTVRQGERAGLAAQALAMAQRLRDPDTLAEVVAAWRFVSCDPTTLEERLAMSTRVMRLAERKRRREMALRARSWRLVDLLELGEIARVKSELARCARLADELRQPLYRHMVAVFHTTLALLQGRLDDVERLATEALELGRRVQFHTAWQVFTMQLVALRREQGRLGEIVADMKACVEQYPEVIGWRWCLAYVYHELGDLEAARSLFDELAADDFERLPRDFTWISALTVLAEVCSGLGDARRAAQLYEFLRPYAGRNVVIGHGFVSYGAASANLAILAATMGRWAEAERYFEEALALNRRLGAPGFLAQIQRAYARTLLRRDAPGDRARALAMIDEMLRTARALDMRAVVAEGAAMKAGAEGRAPEAVTPAPIAPPVFRREGDYWAIGDAGAVVRLKDAKGFRYLARLLERPGEEIHVLELVAVAASDGAGVRPRAGGSGPLLDARAKVAYRRRIAQLREELAAAERANDGARAARARAETEALAEQLAGAVGLGGRDRPAGSDAERARLTVRKRVKDALGKIRERHPALGAHLLGCVKTGYFCVYAPPAARS